jgi:hypothetical protein
MEGEAALFVPLHAASTGYCVVSLGAKSIDFGAALACHGASHAFPGVPASQELKAAGGGSAPPQQQRPRPQPGMLLSPQESAQSDLISAGAWTPQDSSIYSMTPSRAHSPGRAVQHTPSAGVSPRGLAGSISPRLAAFEQQRSSGPVPRRLAGAMEAAAEAKAAALREHAARIAGGNSARGGASAGSTPMQQQQVRVLARAHVHTHSI